MSDKTSLFLLPSLGDVDWELPKLAADEALTSPPWFGWVNDGVLALLLYELVPLLRSLELAGYRTEFVQLGLRGVRADGGDGWVTASLSTMLVYEDAGRLLVPLDWGSAQTAVHLVMAPRLSVAQRSLAIPREVGLLPFPAGAGASEGQSFVCFPIDVALSSADGLLQAIDGSQIGFFVDAMIGGLVERWKRSAETDLGALDPYEFTTPPGLLWLFDPAFWDEDPPLWGDAGARFCREVGAAILEGANREPRAFLELQIRRFERRSEARPATIRGLLGARASASEHRGREFFRIVAERNGQLERPIAEDALETLLGPRWLGYPSPYPYLEVLMHLANARVFPFPALPDPSIPSPYDWEGEPFQVTLVTDDRTGQPGGVEIRVFDQGPVIVYRAVDLGYAYDRCFTWEYKGPGNTGVARLVVVAAPGVIISGGETLPRSCRLEVYRVQDHELVPPWGERISEQLLTAPHDREAYYWRDRALFAEPGPDDEPLPEPDPATFSAEPRPAFRIQPLPAGCRISYPAVDDEEELVFRVDIQLSETSPYQRFTFDIEPAEGESGELQRHALNILATPGVQIGIRSDPGIESRIACFAWRTDDPDPALVPPPGEPLEVPYLLSVARNLDNGDPQFSRMLWDEYLAAISVVKFFVQLGAEVGIGMIPVVGDVVDIAEFAASFVTGKDKWGEPITNFDRALMFGGILLPLVSSGALRGLKKAVP